MFVIQEGELEAVAETGYATATPAHPPLVGPGFYLAFSAMRKSAGAITKIMRGSDA